MLKFTLFWFRRDLRLSDNTGLHQALKNKQNILPVFIFDTGILDALANPKDRRVTFIHSELAEIKAKLNLLGSDLSVYYGDPLVIFKKIAKDYSLESVYANHDYEPGARDRDRRIQDFLETAGISFLTFKDQCIFEKKEILTDQSSVYSVYTPYKKKWLATVKLEHYKSLNSEPYFLNLAKIAKPSKMISLEEMGFEVVAFEVPPKTVSDNVLKNYEATRNIPNNGNGTSGLGLHLRFGTVSVRECVALAVKKNADVWLSELIWRDFFMQILWHYPLVQKRSFKPQYEKIEWRNKKSEFDKWAAGQTGYPLVDAGMRELAQTGRMHNRVRMVVASFLTKHLLTHWYLGERFFAAHLLDYDLSANNGNWQWAAGTGCDAAPYFRVFNPTAQIEKFDPDYDYIKKWVPEWNTKSYPARMVDHAEARLRAIDTYKRGLNTDFKLETDKEIKKGKI